MRDTEDGIPDSATLMRLATGYLARYAASSHRVRQVLERRLRRRRMTADLPPPDEEALSQALDAVIERLRGLGLLDDEAFAAARTRALQRKGLPERRVRMALRSEKLDSGALDERNDAPDDADQARRFAARKRLGPYRLGERAPFRDKDLRSLLRAGFSYGIAVSAIDADAEEF